MFMGYKAAKNIFRESYHRIPCCEFHFPFFPFSFFGVCFCYTSTFIKLCKHMRDHPS